MINTDMYSLQLNTIACPANSSVNALTEAMNTIKVSLLQSGKVVSL